jgi:hypothetical protein
MISINFAVIIILQCIRVSKYHAVYLKYIQFLFVNTSVELRKLK